MKTLYVQPWHRMSTITVGKSAELLISKLYITFFLVIFFLSAPLIAQQKDSSYMILEETVSVYADSTGIQTTRRIIFSMLRDTDFSYDVPNNTHMETLVNLNAERVYRDDRKFISQPLTQSEIIPDDSNSHCRSVRKIRVSSMRRGEMLDCTYTIRSLQPSVSGFHVFAYSVPAQSSTLTITHSAEYTLLMRHDSKKTRYKTSQENGRSVHTFITNPSRIPLKETNTPPDHYVYPTVFFTVLPAQSTLFSDTFAALEKIIDELQPKIGVFFQSISPSMPKESLRNHLLAAITDYPDPESLTSEISFIPAMHCIQNNEDISRALLFLAACRRAGIDAESILIGPHRSETTEEFHPSEITGLYVQTIVSGKSQWYTPHTQNSVNAFSTRHYRSATGYGIRETGEAIKTQHIMVNIAKDGNATVLYNGENKPLSLFSHGEFAYFFIPEDIHAILAPYFAQQRKTPYSSTNARFFVVHYAVKIHKAYEIYTLPESYSFEHKGLRIDKRVTQDKQLISIEIEIHMTEECLTAKEFFELREKLFPLTTLAAQTIILKEAPKRKRFLGIF